MDAEPWTVTFERSGTGVDVEVMLPDCVVHGRLGSSADATETAREYLGGNGLARYNCTDWEPQDLSQLLDELVDARFSRL